jgi:hypothetical protein
MPKQIKFNLIIDKKPIRDIEDLLNNFNIDDILDAYQKGSLKRWLLVRDMTDKIKEFDTITGDTMETALKLSRIFFGEECNKELLASAVYPFEFRKKEIEKLKQFESAKNSQGEIIRAYHDGYDKLLAKMEENSKNYPFLKAAVNEMYEKYKGLYLLDMSRVYQRFISSCPFIILTFLANRRQKIEPLFPKSLDAVWKDINIESLHDVSYVKVFSGETNGYWKDLEPKGKWLIIKMEKGNFIRNLGKNGEELGVDSVNGKFPILEGIDYKSNSASYKLIYMEV